MGTVKKLTALLAALAVCGNFLPAQAEKPAPLKIHMISGLKEYQSEESLTGLKAYLEKHYNIKCTLSVARSRSKSSLG